MFFREKGVLKIGVLKTYRKKRLFLHKFKDEGPQSY